LKVSEKTITGWINPTRESKKYLRKSNRVSKSAAKDFSKTEGIDASEIERRKAAGECLRCAWPEYKKGNHGVRNCHRQIKLDKGTAIFPKDRKYQRPAQSSEGSDSGGNSDSEDSTD